MSFLNSDAQDQASSNYDAGLRSFMLSVYNWMFAGLLVTGGMAYAVAHTSLREIFFHVVHHGAVARMVPTIPGFIAIFAPLAFIFVLSYGIMKLSRPVVQALFLLFSALMGVGLATVLFAFTETSVVKAFFITASVYGMMSLYGYVTKRSLSGLSSFLFMALTGLIVASLVSMFFHSHGFDLLLNFAGILIFAGLTAANTQEMKLFYQEYAAAGEAVGNLGVAFALSMYLNFINLFQNILQLVGSSSTSSSD